MRVRENLEIVAAGTGDAGYAGRLRHADRERSWRGNCDQDRRADVGGVVHHLDGNAAGHDDQSS